MYKMRRFLVVLAIVAVASVALTACAPQTPTAVEPAKDQVDQQTSQDQATVDDALNSAQAKVSELAAAAGGLEARVNGLQVNSDLQEIQRKLTAAIGDAGDKKKQAIDELSGSFNDLIARVEAAAAKLPEGGPVRAELDDFVVQLKDAQASLATAAASYDASSTTTP